VDCKHRPRRLDTKNGYEHCMWCVETGNCDGKGGYCRPHGVVWAVNEDRRMAAENGA
jgi:hypothetical protein